MPITTAYMPSVKNVRPILEAIKSAGVPARFTNEFLKGLGFTSSNDRAILNVLKGLGFLDPQGSPTEHYRRYRDRTQSKQVLAQALREAYSDLFLSNEKAHDLSSDKLKGFFARTTSKGDRVVEQMAATFRALVQHADFAKAPPAPEPEETPSDEEEGAPGAGAAQLPGRLGDLHYNIQIHLPATRDIAVYNAIFRSLRENLL